MPVSAVGFGVDRTARISGAERLRPILAEKELFFCRYSTVRSSLKIEGGGTAVPATRRRQIWLAKISLRSRNPAQLALVHENFRGHLLEALNPDRKVTYYGRDWRLSEPQMGNAEEYITGKLGFGRGRRAEEVHYDEAEHDWVSEEAPTRQGNYAHFVIDVPRQVVAFEDKGDDLSRQAFVNAMDKFLETVGYEVAVMSDARSFEVWLAEVDRVTRFYVSLRRPNPGWSAQAEKARVIAEEISADRLSIEANSEESLNVQQTVLDGAAENAARGNGYFKASGWKGSARRFYDSSRKFLGAVIDLSDSDSSESTLRKIREALDEALSHSDDDDEHRPQ